jgi:hypothetical protein
MRASGRFDTFAKPSANGRYVREADLRHETENFSFGSRALPVGIDAAGDKTAAPGGPNRLAGYGIIECIDIFLR